MCVCVVAVVGLRVQQTSVPKGLIVSVKCLGVCVLSPLLFFPFFPPQSLSLCASAMMKKRERRSYASPGGTRLPPRIDKRDTCRYFLSARRFVPRLRIQRDAGLDLTPAAVWRLLTDGGERWALLMATASLSGSLSTRGAAEGHCVCWWAGEAHRRVEMLLLTFPKS